MNDQTDISRVLDRWLGDDTSAMPDRVAIVVADRIDRQKQRRAWRLPRRLLEMNLLLKAGAAVAAAALIVALGTRFLPTAPSGVGVPAATPTPATSPTPTPSPPRLPDGRLNAGEYVMRAVDGDPMSFTVTAPVGWSGLGGWFIAGPHLSAAPDGIGIAVMHGPRTVDDPCLADTAPSGALTPSGAPGTASVDDLVAELSEFGGGQVTSVTDTTLAGYSGKEVDLELPATLACSHHYVFAEPQGLYAQGPSNRWRIFLLDAGGTTAVVALSDFAATSIADRAAAQGILDSLRITP